MKRYCKTCHELSHETIIFTSWWAIIIHCFRHLLPNFRIERLCAICGEEPSERECPCGRRVCDECSDFGIYSDVDCCKTCAGEIRQAWAECSGHKFEEPYDNEDGDKIEQCEKCSYPHLVEADSSGKE